MGGLTILDQDQEAFLDQKPRVEDYQPEANGKHIVAGPFLEKLADRILRASG